MIRMATTAMKSGRVLVVSQLAYAEEPAPALFMGLKELVRLLHPSLKVRR